MRIYSMTATFGKLVHQTLTLEPGLNIIEAPNEWGKSTWCAFLVAMLYGIDTSSRSKKDFLADKEHYAPWSGLPMSGRICLSWEGKNITIERNTKGRIPFGEFRAYETDTQVSVPELTGENCGQLLLGVEKNVFLRSGFVRLQDLPITQDDSLRRRLNALVTTGDESGASDTLAQKLKDLKNRCRHNRTGELPKVEAQITQLQNSLGLLDALEAQKIHLTQQEQASEQLVERLKNHLDALAYQKSQQAQAHLKNAQKAYADAQQALDRLNLQCQALPSKETAAQELQRLTQLQQQWEQLQQQIDALPTAEETPIPPAPFSGLTPTQAMEKATSDFSSYLLLCKPKSAFLLILSAILLVAGVGLFFLNHRLAVVPFILAAVCIGIFFKNKHNRKKQLSALLQPYKGIAPSEWVSTAETYQNACQQHSQQRASQDRHREQLALRKDTFMQTLALITQNKSVADCLAHWNSIYQLRAEQEAAASDCDLAKAHLQALEGVAVSAAAPAFADSLTLTYDETQHAIEQATKTQSAIHLQLGQCQGQMEALGSHDMLSQQLQQLMDRHRQLENMYAAVTLAQETLTAASVKLQRRFAPQISGKAQVLFRKLTNERYTHFNLAQDLSVSAATAEEDTLRGILWRSEGTTDQLYLALRLAVAQALTPKAPLVLDDALVRFDDKRLSTAMEILKEEASRKQVILFTCQSREAAYKE